MTSIPVLFLAYLVVQAGFTRIRVSSLLAGIIIESQASRELERRAHTEPLYYTDNAIREAQSIAARVETMRLISSLLSHSVDEEVIAVIEGFEETESVTGNLIKKEASELSETRAIEVDIRALRAHFALHDRDKNRALWMLRQDDVESFLDEFSENGYEWKVVATEEWTGPTPLAPSSRSLIVAIVLLEVILLSFLFLGTLDVLLALALRGIPVFLLVGLGLRQMNGRRASRWRCFIRTLLVWMPVPLLLGAIDLKWGWRTPEQLTLAALALGLLPLAHLLTTLLDPRSGLIDKLVGTRVVLS
jgi:hypothetical protein